MLTADLVDARRRGGELVLRKLDPKARDDALELAASILDTARGLVGRRREELDESWALLTGDQDPARAKLAAGLRKLTADACTFEMSAGPDPIAVRQAVFTRASEARRELGDGERFDRDAALADAARELGLEPEAVERALFSDLRAEHILRAAPTLDAESLVEAWELGQAQAALLMATRVTIDVEAGSPGLVRALFAKMKFHRLLFSAERADAGWRIVIDGPYSMFDAVTKYGLELALVLPALRSLERWSLVAELRWGKRREPVTLRLASDPRRPSEPDPPVHLSDDVRELAERIDALGGAWRARPTTTLLEVPGAGVCVPDLALERAKDGAIVYVEVLGYWSRDAVFRRVELAERGLGERVVFAVSSRLRVSAEVLDASAPACLYVYKGKMSPRAVVEHATRVAKAPVSSRAASGRTGGRARASRARGRGN